MAPTAFTACGPGALLAKRPLPKAACARRVVFSPRMALSERNAASAPAPAKKTGLPVRASPFLSVFRVFFTAMNGSWNSERTYHYTRERTRESSQTTFDVTRLSKIAVEAVLASNNETAIFTPQEQAYSEGFNVSFLTRMESEKELVRSSTNLAFVPRSVSEDGIIEGDYYRDLGYEEAAPIAATFMFDSKKKELNMTTYYTKVVSVDQITLVNANVRLRKIVNYVRPKSKEDPLVHPLLVGFGVESKDGARLVQ